MPQSIVPLDRKKHAALTFAPLNNYAFTSEMNMVPLLAFEAGQAARCFPIAFPVAGSAIPHALLGLGKNNIFLDAKGRWKAPYTPLSVANHPFALIGVRGPKNPDTPEVVLAIDEAAPHFHQKKGEPLYEQNGEPTEHLRRITMTLGVQNKRHQNSVPALKELESSQVLMEKPITIRTQKGERVIQGIRIADREAVMALPDETLARWTRNGLMEMVQAHWWSLRHLATLLNALPLKKTSSSGKA